MEICKFCNKQFNTKRGLSLHFSKNLENHPIEKIDDSSFSYVCECNKRFKTKTALKGHRAKCSIVYDLSKKEESILTEEILYKHFIELDLCANTIRKLLNLKYTSVGKLIYLAKSFGIPTKTRKEAANNKSTRDLYKQTCLSKYGDINALGKKSKIFENKNANVLLKYGKTNVFQLESVKEKSKETLFNRYGVFNANQLSVKSNGRKSKPHLKIESLLSEINIQFISEHQLFLNKNGYNPRVDIFIPNENTIIEIYESYYHADPKFYKSSDIINRYKGKLSVKDIWEIDKNREEYIKKFGYNIIIIWESEIKTITKEQLCNILKLKK